MPSKQPLHPTLPPGCRCAVAARTKGAEKIAEMTFEEVQQYGEGFWRDAIVTSDEEHSSPYSASSRHSAAQHAHPADRFAREIVPFLISSRAARSRRLMCNPLGLKE